MEQPAWAASELQAPGDPPWRARYRLLQSWYRETVLGAPPGLYRSKQVGNRLPDEWAAAHPHANFLNDEIARCADERVPQVRKSGGALDEVRLRRNLLSSMPLCFNLFGYLRGQAGPAARCLSTVLGVEIAEINDIEVEWAPEDHPLRDRTAFDAMVWYRSRTGTRGLLGVETKYTEPFSQKEYDRPKYRRLTDHPSSGFWPGAADRLKGRRTNQLWRNALLALGLREGPDFDEGYVVVVHCEGDPGLSNPLAAFRAEMASPDSLLRVATYEGLIECLERDAKVTQWARAFRRRYLDLTLIQSALERPRRG